MPPPLFSVRVSLALSRHCQGIDQVDQQLSKKCRSTIDTCEQYHAASQAELCAMIL